MTEIFKINKKLNDFRFAFLTCETYVTRNERFHAGSDASFLDFIAETCELLAFTLTGIDDGSDDGADLIGRRVDALIDLADHWLDD